MNCAIITPTLNAGAVWGEWISALTAASISANDVYIIDSGSIDDTIFFAEKSGFNVKRIAQNTFNHGGTRRLATNDLAGYDFVIFLTQDAILGSPDSIHKILSPFKNKRVAAVCGRQLPRKEAGAIESHARFYNYPAKSFIRSSNDVIQFGLKTAFISNSFAAYRISALNAVGNFPEDVIFGEDMYVAAKMLSAGYKIAYAADACVYHSHGYSIWQEMKRYFDMGVFHAREPWIRRELGGAEGEGIKFVSSEFKYLLKHAFWRIPEGMVRTLFRYIGFRLGMTERLLPVRVKRKLAMNEEFFRR